MPLPFILPQPFAVHHSSLPSGCHTTQRAPPRQTSQAVVRAATPDLAHVQRVMLSLASAAQRYESKDGGEDALVYVPRVVKGPKGNVFEASVVRVPRQDALTGAA